MSPKNTAAPTDAMRSLQDLLELDVEEELEFSGHDIQINSSALLAKSLTQLGHLIADFQLSPLKPRPGHGPAVTVGFDTEFVADDEAQEQRVLSYQFYLIGPEGEYSRIFYPQSDSREDRLRLDDMLRDLIQEATDAGCIEEFPKRIDFAAFFLRLDLGTLADFDQFKRKLSNISGRLGSGKRDTYIEPSISYLERVPESRTYIYQSEGRPPSIIKQDLPAGYDDDEDPFPRTMRVHFIDIGSHAPEGSNLASIGEALNVPKLSLPEGYSIERMDKLLEDDIVAFEAYALRDAEIAAKFFVKLTSIARKIAQSNELPSTASNLGVTLLKKILSERHISFNVVFGLEDHTPILYDETEGHLRRGKTEKVRINRRDMYEHFITKCYHGGRNECFIAGPTELGLFNDFDLAGAYTTGMVDFPVIDYTRRPIIPETPEAFVGHVVGFAHVRFTYPSNTRFPTLPVESASHGLIFPLSGESYCTAPEIEVALNQGCDIEILDGVIFHVEPGSPRIFEGFVTQIRDLRAAFKKQFEDAKAAGKSRPGLLLWEKYIKLVGNGLYGKTAQGLKKKRVFEAGELKHIDLPHSPITYAACAAHVTGFIRAVMSEIIDRLPRHRTVVSVTTDGFLTDATKEELDACLDGPMASRFVDLCRRVAPGKDALELKHQGVQIVAMKTRGQLTAAAFEDKPIILAKGSVSPPIKPGDGVTPDQFKALQNDYMLDLYLNRQPGQRTTIRPFVSLRDQLVHSKDVIRLTRSIRLNLEFDFKRKPVNPVVRQVNGQDHLAFDTVPWQRADQVDTTREIFDVWAKDHCLKTLDDWASWETYSNAVGPLKAVRKNKRTNINVTGKGAKGILLNTFIRAYVRNLWGTQKTKSYADLAKWLTDLVADNFPEAERITFSKDDVTYAARKGKEPLPHACGNTPENQFLLDLLSEACPNLERDRFLVEE